MAVTNSLSRLQQTDLNPTVLPERKNSVVSNTNLNETAKSNTARLEERNFAASYLKHQLQNNGSSTVRTAATAPVAQTGATPAVQSVKTAASASPPNLNLEESKSVSDIAYEGEQGEVYQFPDGSYWRVERAEEKDSGFRAVAMRQVVPDGSGGYQDDPNDNRVAIGFAGTNGGDDWNDNILQGVGLTPAQYDQALTFTKGVQQEAAKNGEAVTLTGHSLGGGLASYVSIQTGISATAINSAPLSNNKVPDDVDYSNQITQYYSSGEILTDFDNSNEYDHRPGAHVEVSAAVEEPSWYEYIFDPGGSIGREFQASLDNHGLDNTAPEIAAPIRVY